MEVSIILATSRTNQEKPQQVYKLVLLSIRHQKQILVISVVIFPQLIIIHQLLYFFLCAVIICPHLFSATVNASGNESNRQSLFIGANSSGPPSSGH